MYEREHRLVILAGQLPKLAEHAVRPIARDVER